MQILSHVFIFPHITLNHPPQYDVTTEPSSSLGSHLTRYIILVCVSWSPRPVIRTYCLSNTNIMKLRQFFRVKKIPGNHDFVNSLHCHEQTRARCNAHCFNRHLLDKAAMSLCLSVCTPHFFFDTTVGPQPKLAHIFG